MKKFLSIFVALFVVFVFCTTVIAGTIGNPNATIENKKLTFDFDTDFTNRDIESGGTEAEVDSSRLLVKGTYGLATGQTPLNVYLKLGMANCENDDSNFNGDYGLAYDLGLKATVYNTTDMQIGVGVQYLSYASEDSYDVPLLGSIETEMDASEIDLFAGASYLGFNKVTPYGGLHFTKIDGDYSEKSSLGTYSGDFEEADTIGLFMGLDLGISDQFKGGAELRLVSETSFSINLSYLF